MRGVLAGVERSMIDRFGLNPARASVTFVGVDPIEVLRWSGRGAGPRRSTVMVTLGMAGAPMGASGRRAELLVEVYGEGDQLWRQLAVLAAAPVVEAVVYSPGMTVELGGPIDASSLCVGGLIVASDVGAVATAAGEVTIFRVIPATANELAYSRLRGSTALQELWCRAETDLFDLGRSSVELNVS